MSLGSPTLGRVEPPVGEEVLGELDFVVKHEPFHGILYPPK